jgi:RNA polymerase-binding transcription factor DksA
MAKRHQKVRHQLESQLAELTDRVSEIDEDLREPAEQDFMEHAIGAEGDEVLEGLGNAAPEEIARIQDALSHMELGISGDCRPYGLPIPEARPEAALFAAHYMDCLDS